MNRTALFEIRFRNPSFLLASYREFSSFRTTIYTRQPATHARNPQRTHKYSVQLVSPLNLHFSNPSDNHYSHIILTQVKPILECKMHGIKQRAMSEKPHVIGPELQTDEPTNMISETVGSLQVYFSYMNDVLKELKEFKNWAEPILKKCECGAHKVHCGNSSNGKRSLRSGTKDLVPLQRNLKIEPEKFNTTRRTYLPVREVQNGDWKIRGKDGNPVGPLEPITWKYN